MKRLHKIMLAQLAGAVLFASVMLVHKQTQNPNARKPHWWVTSTMGQVSEIEGAPNKVSLTLCDDKTTKAVTWTYTNTKDVTVNGVESEINVSATIDFVDGKVSSYTDEQRLLSPRIMGEVK